MVISLIRKCSDKFMTANNLVVCELVVKQLADGLSSSTGNIVLTNHFDFDEKAATRSTPRLKVKGMRA